MISTGDATGRRRRLSLRTTIMLSFALGGLLLSTTMALGTYLAARAFLVDQRERTATRQAFTDASFVRDGLLTRGAKVSDVLGLVSLPADAAIVVRRGDRWFSSSLEVGEADVPAALRQAAADGSASMSWVDGPDGSALMVEVPLPAVGVQLFERTSAKELSNTLDALRVVLMVVAALTAVAAAVLGRWAARRVVAPLDDVAAAAAQIASGALDTRLASTDDPELSTIVASFNSMVDAVHERIERDARFAADVSHELRSPLTALVTSVDVLKRRRDQLPERSREALDLIERDLTRFQRAVEDLLDLGRLEAGAAALVMTPVDVRDLVRQVADTSGVPSSQLVLPTGAAPVTVRVDKPTMHRALLNLVENAERHGRGLSAITVGTAEGSVVIAVDDRGPGVSPVDRVRIFERFVRGGSRGSLPGTGLGLSLVAETVRAHGGAVWCTSGPEEVGSRFVVQLPAVDAALVDDDSPRREVRT